MLDTETEAKNILVYLLGRLRAEVPFANGFVSTLVMQGRASILLTIAFDLKEYWPNGILENSTYAKFHIQWPGTGSFPGAVPGSIELIIGHGTAKFRKTAVTTDIDVVKKLTAWIEATKAMRAQRTEAYVAQITKDAEPLTESLGVDSTLILVKLGEDDWVVHEYSRRHAIDAYDALQDFKIMAGQKVLLVKVLKAK